jgi:hypothetical protein
MLLLVALAMLADIQAADYFPMYEGQTVKTRALVQPYFDCAFYAAGKMEKSGDAPNEVAKAAMTVCDDDRADLQASIDADLALAPSEPETGLSDKVMNKLDTWMAGHLQMRIVAKRAIRAGN